MILMRSSEQCRPNVSEPWIIIKAPYTTIHTALPLPMMKENSFVCFLGLGRKDHGLPSTSECQDVVYPLLVTSQITIPLQAAHAGIKNHNAITIFLIFLCARHT